MVVHAVPFGGFLTVWIFGEVVVVQRTESLAKNLRQVTLISLPESRLVLNNDSQL